MNKSFLLCGVGGQGTVLASRVIAQAAMEKGEFARTSETIGMAQRGGCVVSHVRIGNMLSPLIPQGGADVLIGFEPGEAVRCIGYLKKGGLIVTAKKTVQPVSAAMTGSRIDGGEMIEYLRKKTDRIIVVDTDKICEECGTSKVLNTALLGAAAAAGELGVTVEEVSAVLEQRLPARVMDINKKALAMGALYR